MSMVDTKYIQPQSLHTTIVHDPTISERRRKTNGCILQGHNQSETLMIMIKSRKYHKYMAPAALLP